jgi:hypothetical protein
VSFECRPEDGAAPPKCMTQNSRTRDSEPTLQNYFNYFTEIEEHYQRRRGSGLLLSTLDWALIETWKDAGLPLAAVLRGIDATFDKYERKPARAKTRKINSLAYCSQEVLAAAEEMKDAATGAAPAKTEAVVLPEQEVRAYLRTNAEALRQARVIAPVGRIVEEAAATLQALTEDPQRIDPEHLERRLTVLEEKIFAGLMTAMPEDELLEIRTSADRDIAPYRSKMTGPQIDQLHRQYMNKRLLEKAKLPRLSLFYMP